MFCTLLDALLSGLSLAQIPTQEISVLATIVSYGSYVVGSDLLLCFASVVSGWILMKMTVGIGLFIWRFLPFT